MTLAHHELELGNYWLPELVLWPSAAGARDGEGGSDNSVLATGGGAAYCPLDPGSLHSM